MKDKSYPKISFLIPHYNMAQYLSRALKYLCNQDPVPHEILVLDDCSTDNSRDVLEDFGRRYSFLRVVRYPEKSRDWTQALWDHVHLLTGDYIQCGAADDIIYEGFTRHISEAVCRYGEPGVVFADYELIDEAGTHVRFRRSGFKKSTFLQGRGLHRQLLRPQLFESGVASVVRADLFRWLGRRDINRLGIWAEQGWVLASLRAGAAYVPEVLGGFTMRADAHNSNTFRNVELCLSYYEKLQDELKSAEHQDYLPASIANALDYKVINSMPRHFRKEFLAKYPGKRLGRILVKLRSHVDSVVSRIIRRAA